MLHDLISPMHGTMLGCGSVREELARLCEQEAGEEADVLVAEEGEDFAQREPLDRRIQGLLQKYNDEKVRPDFCFAVLLSRATG